MTAVDVKTKFTVTRSEKLKGKVYSACDVDAVKTMSVTTILPSAFVPTACTVQSAGAAALPTALPAPGATAQRIWREVRSK